MEINTINKTKNLKELDEHEHKYYTKNFKYPK